MTRFVLIVFWIVAVYIALAGLFSIAHASPDPAPGAKSKITWVAYDYTLNTQYPFIKVHCHQPVRGKAKCHLVYVWGWRP